MERFIEVIGFGALNCDTICKVDKIPSPGQEVGVISVERQPGGSAANTIVGLARLGVRTGFLGVIGDDVKGGLLLDDLRHENVDVQGISRLEGYTGTALAFIDAAGERTIYVLPSVNDAYSAENCDYVRQAAILHVSSFMTAQQLRLQIECVNRAKDQGTRISFSPGNAYAALGLEQLTSLIERAAIVFLNDEEAQALTGTAYAESADSLLRLGAETVAITLGSEGCYIATRDEHIVVPAFETKVRDTIGAGDAFAAGFLYGQLRKASAYQSGLYGNYFASKCIAELGARKGLTFTAEELSQIQ
ncbi:MAG: carbohydrate kinase family protein [Euryarchaeota archaeon]|nr:carbohydrate kinase family protein [Euryarchaeota archaeon]